MTLAVWLARRREDEVACEIEREGAALVHSDSEPRYPFLAILVVLES